MTSKYSVALTILAAVGLGAGSVFAPTVPHIEHGTHAPASAKNVWQVLTKGGETAASAVPVAMKDDKTVIFLTAGHVARALRPISIVQDMTKNRKLRITKVTFHETEDLGILWVKLGPKPVELVELDLNVELTPGLSVFSVGYPMPNNLWFCFRGYLAVPEWSSAPTTYGMSGGGLLLNNGKLVCILIGLAAKDAKTWPNQNLHVPLFLHKDWLKDNGVE